MLEFSGAVLTPDYKLLLLSIYFVGVLTGGIIGSIVLALKKSEWRNRNE